MGRARALRDAYQKLIEEHPQPGAIPLTVLDVYRWLEDEQLFPRGNNGKRSSILSYPSTKNDCSATAVADAFCARCGLRKVYHPAPVKSEGSGLFDGHAHSTVSLSLATLTSPCTTFVEAISLPPLLDIKYLIGPFPENTASWFPYALAPSVFISPFVDREALRVDPAALVSCANPGLVSSIERLTQRWDIRYPSLRSNDNVREDGRTLADRTTLHRPKPEVFDRVAPYATLALLTRSVVKLLIRRGLESFRRDEMSLRSVERQDRSRRRGGQASGEASSTRRLLTPSHIFRGLASAARNEVLDSSVLIALSRLGESVHSEVAIGMGNNREEAFTNTLSNSAAYIDTRSRVVEKRIKAEEA